MATSRICAIPDCGKPSKARGWCSLHHQRWRKYGFPSGGGTLKGEGQRFLKDKAILFGGDGCLLWPYGRHRKGYGVVVVDGAKWLTHRFVCMSVNGPPPSDEHQAAHSCGNALCCNPKHIRWATASENQMDRVEHGTSNRGRGRLTARDVSYIRSLKGAVADGVVAANFGISAKYVWELQSRKKWSWLA